MREARETLGSGARTVLHDSAADELELEEGPRFVEELPCAWCGRFVPVTQALLDMAADANHVRHAMGWPLARKSELVLCQGDEGDPGGCYGRWRGQLEWRAHQRWQEDQDAWKSYLADPDADPAVLRQTLNDRSAYEAGIRAVEKRRRQAEDKRQAKEATKRTDSAAGFQSQQPPQGELQL